MSLIVEITQQNGLVVRQPVDPNSTKIAAQPGDKIRILDAETGQSVGDLVARRVGDSLVVEQAGGATVELTEFFAPGASGEGCELVLEDGEKTTTISQATEPMGVAADGTPVMYDAAVAAQAGAAPAQQGAAAAAGAAEGGAAGAGAAAGTSTGAVLAGVGALGLAAAAGGGGGSGGGGGGGDDQNPPGIPTIDPVAGGDGVDADEAAAGITVTGTAEPGSTVTVVWSGADESYQQEGIADENGAWSVMFPTDQVPEDGATTISATAANAHGSSEPATQDVTVDTTPPKPAAIDAVTGDNTVSAADAAAGVEITGTAEEGATVAVTWGGITKDGIVGAGGVWSVTFGAGEVPADGESDVSVMVTDAAGNAQVAPPTTQTVTVEAVADSGGTGDSDVRIGGAGDSILFGGAGNDVLVGDSAGSIRNYQFDYWSSIGGTYTPEDAVAGGLLGDPGIRGSSIGYHAGETFGGWRVGTVDNPGAGGSSGDTAEMRGTAAYYDLDGISGTLLWETVFAPASTGSGLTQQVDTLAGENYTLSITFGTTPNGTSFEVWWDGNLVASYDGSADAPVNAEGSWIPPLDPAAITNISDDQTTISFTVPGVGQDTELELRAYHTAGGIGDGMLVHRVTLDAVSPGGDDVLVGGEGNDLIYGQGGNDTLWGGEGADMFVYSMLNQNGSDTVMDFEVGVDRIMLVDAIDANTTGSSSPVMVENSDENLTYEDFLGTGDLGLFASQAIGIEEDAEGNLVLTFTGEDNADLGSVTLHGVARADYSDVESLFTGGIIDVTGDGFHTNLNSMVV